jgi:hypothetical protein
MLKSRGVFPRAIDFGPLIITGHPYSGTTLLYRILARNPNFAWLSRFTPVGKLGKSPFSIRALNKAWDKVGRNYLTPFWSKPSYLNSYQQLLEKIVPSPVEKKDFWQQIKNPENLKSQIGQVLSWQNKSRFLGKAPFLVNKSQALVQCFPDVKIIHCCRDGYVQSLRALTKDGREISTRNQNLEKRRRVLMSSAVSWTRSTEMSLGAFTTFGPEQVMVVRYEDFILDINFWVKKICSWAGVEHKDDYLAGVPCEIRSTNEKYLTFSRPNDRDFLTPVFKDTLARSGYDF